MTRRNLLQLISCVFCLLFPGLVAANTAPIRIGMSLGLTGRYSVIAKMQERAFRLWETTTNQQGGILGRNIQLTIYDDKSDGETARQLYRRMIQEEKLDLLFPPYSSGLTTAILPITEAHGYPILTHGAAADSIWQQGYRYVFGLFPPASRYPLGFQELILMEGLKKLAIVSADDPFSRNIAKGAELWSRRLGLQIVLRRTVKKGTADLDATALAAKQANAQALIMCGHFNEAVNMRQGLINVNWYPMAYWASVGPVFQSYFDHFGTAAEGTFTSSQWTFSEKLPFPGSKAFHDSFVAVYGEEPSYHAAAAYTAGVVLAAGIKRAGSLDRNKIRDMLASMEMMTLLGRYHVDRTGMQIGYFHLILQWTHGRKEIVWPMELRTAPPVFSRDVP